MTSVLPRTLLTALLATGCFKAVAAADDAGDTRAAAPAVLVLGADGADAAVTEAEAAEEAAGVLNVEALPAAALAAADAGEPLDGAAVTPGPATTAEPEPLPPHSGVPDDPIFDLVRERARVRAASPYVPADRSLPPALMELPVDATRSIRFRPDRAIWSEPGLMTTARLFHRGPWFRYPVQINEVVDGEVRHVPYRHDWFDVGSSGLDAESLPEDLGYAGLSLFFRNQHQPSFKEAIAFLGASYFRAVGEDHHWGASVRGIAIDTGLTDRPEEFPHFVEFWVTRPSMNEETATIYALLDGPSVSGAYRFVVRPGMATTVDTDVSVFFRHSVSKLGLAPLTSMFLFGEEEPGRHGDWRPEVHDSDGLLMITREGEQIWRPLDAPEFERVSRFQLESPRGFGLIQRDRNFDHYQDNQFEYHRRPSIWVQADTDWGKGAVELIEFASADEDFDNMAAFWVPADASFVDSPNGHDLSYTLWFCDDEPPEPAAGRFLATRRGVPQALLPTKREDDALRFVLEAAGGGLEQPSAKETEVVVTVDGGRVIGEPSVNPNIPGGT